MDKCKKEKENIYKTTCKDCEYNDNCENVTKKGEIKMTIIISMNNEDCFMFEITEENYKTFKVDVSIYNWLKLNDYGFKEYTEVYIRKENISYYGIL